MGRYTNQAGSYKHGMDMVRSGLEKALAELEKAKVVVSSGDSCDALNHYVSKFNTEITVTLNEIKGKSISLPASVMSKAIEIDRRIEMELEEARRRQEEMANSNKENQDNEEEIK